MSQESETAERSGALTEAEMIELLERHMATEMNGDVEGMLATVSSEPRFTGYPEGHEVSGLAEFRARYSVLLPMFKDMFEAELKRVWVDVERQDLVAEFQGWVNHPNGERIALRTLAIFEFAEGRIQHEIAFSSQFLPPFTPAE